MDYDPTMPDLFEAALNEVARTYLEYKLVGAFSWPSACEAAGCLMAAIDALRKHIDGH